MNRRWRRALRHRAFAIGLVLTIAIVGTAVCSLVYTPRDPLRMELTARLEPPSASHLMGTDQYGRDLLSRVMRGAVASLAVGAVAVAIGMAAGIVLGAAGGWVGGWLDEAAMRVADAIYGFPAVLSALLAAAVFGPSVLLSMVAVGIAYVPVFARLMRASVLALRAQEFVTAARALGAPGPRIVLWHILPNILNPIVVQVTLSTAFAILAEAALSFLGLGAQPPTPSWGQDINYSQRYLANQMWWMSAGPGIAIFLAVFAFNFLGDALRDALDPQLRSRA